MNQKLKGKIMKIKRSEVIQLANKYIGNDSLEAQNQILLKIATARAARISYTTLGDNPKVDYEADIKLHDGLLAMEHMSPFEHCARCMTDAEYSSYVSGNLYPDKAVASNNVFGWSRNFKGFIQYRALID